MKNFQDELLNAAKSAKSCQFISMCYVSEPKLNKSQKLALAIMGGFDEIVPIEKVSEGTFQFNFSYENAVNNRGEKENGEPINFVGQSLAWGKWYDGLVNKVIEHKGELYLRFYWVKNCPITNEYFVGGNPATKEQIALIEQFTERKPIGTQTAAGVTENQVVARSVKFDNILSITMGGKVFESGTNVQHA